MSQENVEIVEKLSRCVNRRDVEGVVTLCSEDVVFLAARSAIEGAYLGHDGMRRFFADTAGNFRTFQLNNSELRDLDDCVLAIGTVHVQGRASGVATEMPSCGIVTIEYGKIVRWQNYGDRASALKAVGLEE
jgi:ketosteroid isomerase-like protein